MKSFEELPARFDNQNLIFRLHDIEEIERQISLYIDENLNFCLCGFVGFAYPVQALSEPKTTTYMAEGKVVFQTSYNLNEDVGGNLLSLDTFQAEIPTSFEHAVFIADANYGIQKPI